MKSLFQGDCLDYLDKAKDIPLLFADPPDNLGLAYADHNDKMPKSSYYDWLHRLIFLSLKSSHCFWLSYYWEHDMEIKYMVRTIINSTFRSVKAKTFIWRYTFGQYKETDCASGFRFLLRLSKPQATFNPDAIREPSKRMELGDPRAKGPRVPDDVWEFPRVVGNSPERRGLDTYPTSRIFVPSDHSTPQQP